MVDAASDGTNAITATNCPTCTSMANYTKRIACLANSRKHSGRCIAGKEILADGHGPWVRPISARPSAEVSEEERRYENGQDPRTLDIIDVPIIAATPILFQTENHVIDTGCYWTKVGELPWTTLADLVDEFPTLWVNGDSTYQGLNDRVKLEEASKLVSSLALIKPQKLTIVVQTEGETFGNPRRRVRAHFRHNNCQYILVVTDPMSERTFLARSNGSYSLTDAYLCVSLGEPHSDGYCYKLVAAIIGK